MSALNTRHFSRQLRRLYGRNCVHRIISAPAGPVVTDLLVYRDDPVGFARDVLKYEPTEDQEKILRAFPGRVKVNAGHSVGKTSVGAVSVLWWYHTRPKSVVITTAPTERDVIDLLWSEIRILSARAELAPPFVGPRAPEIFHHQEHWAKGYTARSGESFQGRHRESMFFLFDEDEDVDPIYWQTTGTMFKPEEDHCWLAIGNPVTTSSQSYLEDLALSPSGEPKWNLISLSALNHPNIKAQLEGRPPPIPNAVSLAQVHQWFEEWTTRVKPDERRASDVEWPPTSGVFHRPGPLFKSRVQGIRPTEGVDTVWGSESWEKAITAKIHPQYCWEQNYGVTVGVDVAVYGCFDDQTEILTDRGWHRFQDLRGDENVLTRRDGASEWGPITKIHKYAFDGYLNLMDKNKGSVNFCITDNHRLLAKSPHHAKYQLKEYENLPQHFQMPRSVTWAGKPVTPIIFERNREMSHGGNYRRQWEFDPNDWCEFLGWYVSEGSVNFNAKRGQWDAVQIAQISSPAKLDKIRDLLRRMNLPVRYTGRQFVFSNVTIAAHLIEHCGKGASNKRVPEYVRNATPEQLEIFLDSFCAGDGTFRAGRRLAYVTTSKLLADDLQEMLAKIGKAGKLSIKQVAGSAMVMEGRHMTRKHDVYLLHERCKSEACYVNKKDVTAYRYTGNVYCVSTPHKTICVRRNGCVMWSGNSDDSVIHVRTGPLSLHHEHHNGWSPKQLAERIKSLCVQWAAWYNAQALVPTRPQLMPGSVKVVVELDGPGVAVLDRCDNFGNWSGLKVAEASDRLDSMSKPMYSDKRSELWFTAEEKAAAGRMDLSRLPKDVLIRLRTQLMTPSYKLESNGSRRVESKKDYTKRLGRSPDDADGLLVSYAETITWLPKALFRKED